MHIGLPLFVCFVTYMHITAIPAMIGMSDTGRTYSVRIRGMVNYAQTSRIKTTEGCRGVFVSRVVAVRRFPPPGRFVRISKNAGPEMKPQVLGMVLAKPFVLNKGREGW